MRENAPCKSSRQRLLETVQAGRGKELGISAGFEFQSFFDKGIFHFYFTPFPLLFFWFSMPLCNCYYSTAVCFSFSFFFLPQNWPQNGGQASTSQGTTPENGERNRDRSSWSSGGTWLVKRAINEIWIVRVELRTEMGKTWADEVLIWPWTWPGLSLRDQDQTSHGRPVLLVRSQ